MNDYNSILLIALIVGAALVTVMKHRGDLK